MLSGTITAFDPRGAFGVIDADDGRLMVFNIRGMPISHRRGVELGTRVLFDVAEVDDAGLRAVSVTPVTDGSGAPLGAKMKPRPGA